MEVFCINLNTNEIYKKATIKKMFTSTSAKAALEINNVATNSPIIEILRILSFSNPPQAREQKNTAEIAVFDERSTE